MSAIFHCELYFTGLLGRYGSISGWTRDVDFGSRHRWKFISLTCYYVHKRIGSAVSRFMSHIWWTTSIRQQNCSTQQHQLSAAEWVQQNVRKDRSPNCWCHGFGDVIAIHKFTHSRGVSHRGTNGSPREETCASYDINLTIEIDLADRLS